MRALTLHKGTHDERSLHYFNYHPCALGYRWRLGNLTSNKRETRMKHANDLFAQAVNELIAIGEKARKERETLERKAADRETIRVKRKEKRANVRLTEREKVQLTFNL